MQSYSKKLILALVLELIIVLDFTSAKPSSSVAAHDPIVSSHKVTSFRVHRAEVGSTLPLNKGSATSTGGQQDSEGSGRRVISSWNDDGNWQASARLPSSSQSGGNDHSSSTDLTNIRTRTIDTDTKSDDNDNNVAVPASTTGRFNRRLHKWDKNAEELSDEMNEGEGDDGDGDSSHLAQSLSSMASHLLEKGVDESLENSSERDVFINNKKEQSSSSSHHQQPETTDNVEADTDENSSDEENDTGTTNPKTTTWQDEDDTSEDDKMIEKQKSDGSPTTPKGLTTWSVVNGADIKGTVQKIPSEFTVSGALSFNTDRPTTDKDKDNNNNKERSTYPTTELPRTTKSNFQNQTPTIAMNMNNIKNKRKPYYKNKKVVAPSKFVKPQLAEVTAEAIGTDATHTIYKTKVNEPAAESKQVVGNGNRENYYPYNTTKRPPWPYQTTRRVMTTKRPVAFSKITNKPANKSPSYGKKPSTQALTLTTPTTTTPPSTTTYHRNPAPLMYPFPSISFTNLGFMDFLRSQIIPRIGLSLISFMAASPLILSMLGASAVGRRKKRSVDINFTNTDSSSPVQFQSRGQKILPKFDFSAIKKKLHKLEMIQYKKKGMETQGPNKHIRVAKNLVQTVTELVNKFMSTKTFSMLKSKFLDSSNQSKNNEKKQKHGQFS